MRATAVDRSLSLEPGFLEVQYAHLGERQEGWSITHKARADVAGQRSKARRI